MLNCIVLYNSQSIKLLNYNAPIALDDYIYALCIWRAYLMRHGPFLARLVFSNYKALSYVSEVKKLQISIASLVCLYGCLSVGTCLLSDCFALFDIIVVSFRLHQVAGLL